MAGSSYCYCFWADLQYWTLAGPLFEGKMTGCLIDILNGNKQFADMLTLVLLYILITAAVQSSRYIKRFYVRRFAK